MSSLALPQPDTAACRDHPPRVSSSCRPSTPPARAQSLGLPHELEDVGAVLHVLGHVCAENGLNYRLASVSKLGARKLRENIVRPALLQYHLRMPFSYVCVCLPIHA